MQLARKWTKFITDENVNEIKISAAEIVSRKLTKSIKISKK